MPQYQGVWTLEAQAQAQSNQQWVTDPNFKNTTLLLQADGTGSGSQNQTFLDGSTNNFFITRNGNTTQGSFSPFSQAPGYWSNYFNGSSYLNTSSLAAMPSSFTIEGWVYVTSTSTNRFVNGSFYLDIVVATGSNMKLQFYDGATVTADAINVIPLNTWTHVAVVRSGGGSNNCSFYVNGVRGTQFTSAVSFGSSAWQIGALSSSSQYFYGYISNLRFCNSAVYTGASFTPTTTTLTTTSQGASSCILLTCQSNRFLDNSATAATFTTGGTPSVQAFAPFAPALQWTPDVVGGSGYFDGSGDYLIVSSASAQPAFDMGTGDYTTEMWAYFNSVSGLQSLIDYRTSDTTGQGFILYTNGTTLNVYYSGSNRLSYSNVLTNTWYNISVVKSSGVYTLYVNGVQSGATWSNSDAIAAPANRPIIGYDGTLTPFPFNGYICGLRITKGGALYTTTYTPPTIPPTTTVSSGTVSLLLNYTNAGIYDGKMGNVLETVGNAQVSTNPVKYGSGSMYFPATNGNYCVAPASPLLAFGTGDFTAEAWVYPTAFTNNPSGLFFRGINGSNNTTQWGIELNSSGTASFIWNDLNRFSSSRPLPLSVWTHIAVVRSNGVLTMYFNGVSVGTYSATNDNITVGTSTTLFWVGTNNQVPGSRQFIGYIDDLRVTQGVARYFTTFTPPQQALPRQ
jgi:hypothetical protein